MENRRPALKQLSLRFLDLPALRRAASIHFTSGREREEAIAADASIEAMPFAIIPLPLPPMGTERQDPEALFHRFPEIRGRTIILFLSRIAPKKGLELLLDAMAPLCRRYPDALLLVAGDGDESYVRELQTRVANTSITDHVFWAGFLQGTEKTAAFRAATVFVLPSYSENFGIAAQEALAHGIPSVVAEGVALSHDIKEADAGLVIPAETEAIADALVQLLEDPVMRARLAANARDLVKKKYSPGPVGDALIELYESVASKS